ncbi:MAG: helix-turn-helix transcriptional regulator [Actinomycetota bacterium]
MSTVDSQSPNAEHAPINATAASLLGFLYWRPLSGGEIVAAVEASVGYFWNVTRSQIYRELQALAQAGLVEVGAVGPRGKSPYAVTEEGRRAFLTWLRQDPGPDLIRSPFLLKFFFGALLEEDALRGFVAARRTHVEESLSYLRALLPTIVASDPAPAHVVRFGIAFEESVLAWLDAIPWDHLSA